MIAKFKTIVNVGSFLHFDWDEGNPAQVIDAQGNPCVNHNGQPRLINSAFPKYAILYGENATGKSTLVRILRSLNQSDSELITKNWDEPTIDRSIVIELNDGSEITFTEGSGWSPSQLQDRFLFFDKKFVADSVHSGDATRSVLQDKNTGKLILQLGSFAAYENQLSNLQQLRNSLHQQTATMKTTVDSNLKTLVGDDVTIEMLTADRQRIDDKATSEAERQALLQTERDILQAATTNVQSLKKQQSQADAIEKLEQLEKISRVAEIQETRVREMFSFSIAKGTADILKAIGNRKSFVRSGVEHIHSEDLGRCPFCLQSIKDPSTDEYIQVIKEYEAIFDEEFQERERAEQIAIQEYQDILASMNLNQQQSDNQDKLDATNAACSMNETLRMPRLTSIEQTALDREKRNLQTKKTDPLQTLESSDTPAVLRAISDLNVRIDQYNNRVDTINQTIISRQKAVTSGTISQEIQTAERLRDEAARRVASIQNYAEIGIVLATARSVENNEQTVSALGALFGQIRDKIKSIFEVFVDDYLTDMQSVLHELCPALVMEVSRDRVNYDLRVGEVLCGFRLSYKAKDRLTELSEGERQAIALAYFVALLKKATTPDSMYVIIDDPITSFDSGRRRHVAELLIRETEPFAQTFVLTCDPLFRYYCQKVRIADSTRVRSLYYVLKSASSALHYIPTDKADIYGAFKAEFRRIGSIQGSPENIIMYGQKLRFCIEGVKDRYLGYRHDSLDQVLTAVQKNNIQHLLDRVEPLLEIYSYCNTGGLAHYPRDGSTSWDELCQYIRRYLMLHL